MRTNVRVDIIFSIEAVGLFIYSICFFYVHYSVTHKFLSITAKKTKAFRIPTLILLIKIILVVSVGCLYYIIETECPQSPMDELFRVQTIELAIVLTVNLTFCVLALSFLTKLRVSEI